MHILFLKNAVRTKFTTLLSKGENIFLYNEKQKRAISFYTHAYIHTIQVLQSMPELY